MTWQSCKYKWLIQWQCSVFADSKMIWNLKCKNENKNTQTCKKYFLHTKWQHFNGISDPNALRVHKCASIHENFSRGRQLVCRCHPCHCAPVVLCVLQRKTFWAELTVSLVFYLNGTVTVSKLQFEYFRFIQRWYAISDWLYTLYDEQT